MREGAYITNDEWDLLPLDAILKHLERRYDAMVFVAKTRETWLEEAARYRSSYLYVSSGNNFTCLGLTRFAEQDTVKRINDTLYPNPG